MIHFKNVSKYFHDKAVIEKINMEINDGDLVKADVERRQP